MKTTTFAPRGSFDDEALAAENLTDVRWWTLPDLEAASDVVFAPRDLACRLRDLLENGSPASPLALGE